MYYCQTVDHVCITVNRRCITVKQQWWNSRNFSDNVLSGNIAQIEIGAETGIKPLNVNVQHIAKYLDKKGFGFVDSKRFVKRVRKRNITSFVYLLNCGDPRAEAYIMLEEMRQIVRIGDSIQHDMPNCSLTLYEKSQVKIHSDVDVNDVHRSDEHDNTPVHNRGGITYDLERKDARIHGLPEEVRALIWEFYTAPVRARAAIRRVWTHYLTQWYIHGNVGQRLYGPGF
jgi:hypothetical protein